MSWHLVCLEAHSIAYGGVTPDIAVFPDRKYIQASVPALCRLNGIHRIGGCEWKIQVSTILGKRGSFGVKIIHKIRKKGTYFNPLMKYIWQEGGKSRELPHMVIIMKLLSGLHV